MEKQKTLKQYCKEAKKRLKQGFWQNYKDGLEKELEKAEQSGLSVSKVKEYYTERVVADIKNVKDDFESFYLKVKKLLEEEGEVSNAIGRLTDKDAFDKMNYEEKQRYTLSLSEKYIKAVERYRKEKDINYKG